MVNENTVLQVKSHWTRATIHSCGLIHGASMNSILESVGTTFIKIEKCGW